MSVMVKMLTRADLDALPDDGLRHELIDGTLLMSPSPGSAHQRMVGKLYRTLCDSAADTDLEVMIAPFDVVLGSNVVEPDILVAPASAIGDRDISSAPLLVVEVNSPSTGWIDQTRKRDLYQDFGVASYWLADPAGPSITVLELLNGLYVEKARASGDQSIAVATPFPVTLNPAQLLSR